MIEKEKKIKQPWPTKAAMQQVYALGLWGNGVSSFYSGEGSHAAHITQPYRESVSAFFASFESPLVVCDLGCGDFNVGKKLVEHAQHYIAVDIVPELIVFNKANFKHEKVSFQCLNIATDELPIADCAIVRQVLQHLSNAEIQAIIQKLSQYTYVIITEHIPNGNFTANLDIISGQGTRLKKGSGVNVLAPPFEFFVMEERELCSVDLGVGKGLVRTTIYSLSNN